MYITTGLFLMLGEFVYLMYLVEELIIALVKIWSKNKVQEVQLLHVFSSQVRKFSRKLFEPFAKLEQLIQNKIVHKCKPLL